VKQTATLLLNALILSLLCVACATGDGTNDEYLSASGDGGPRFIDARSRPDARPRPDARTIPDARPYMPGTGGGDAGFGFPDPGGGGLPLPGGGASCTKDSDCTTAGQCCLMLSDPGMCIAGMPLPGIGCLPAF